MPRKHPTRREFLQSAAAASLLPLSSSLVGCDANEAPPPVSVFAHGVASGDPTPDSVILWTRVSKAEEPVSVRWQVARDRELRDVVASGKIETSDEVDYTVKLDVSGLTPGRPYYYAFEALGESSPVGRTKTAPVGDVERLRFAVMTCSNFAFGYFHGYRDAATRDDLDAVIHLGDYIYEYADGVFGGFRALDPPWEVIRLGDYRRRYAHYRSDPDLQALHATHPLISVWDDHELANNAWRDGAYEHMPHEGSFIERRAAAQRAYAEWMPIRMPASSRDDRARIFRTLRYGALVDLIMLDTRSWGRDLTSSDAETILDSERTLLGSDQERWLADELAAASAQYVIIGQQVMMAPLLRERWPINTDQWDGYVHARDRVLSLFETHAPGRVVVLAGDLHAAVAGELIRDPDAYDAETGQGVVAVELVTPGVTSRLARSPESDGLRVLLPQNPHLRYIDAASYGYLLLDIDAERMRADFLVYDDVEAEEQAVAQGPRFVIEAGVPRLLPEKIS